MFEKFVATLPTKIHSWALADLSGIGASGLSNDGSGKINGLK
jgi:hypothetical protein